MSDEAPDLVVVFRAHSDVEVAIVGGLLAAHGIQSLVSSHAPRAIFPVSVGGLAEVRVAVRAEDADEARRLIASYRADSPRGAVVRWRDHLSDLEERIGHTFADRQVLERALTHRSHAHEDTSGESADNERLEFLGDAVLGLVVAEALFREFPELDEGHTSKMKALLVSAPTLTAVAERLDLGAHVRLGRGEEKTGGRGKQALLADACEAVIAALYLDGGMEAARGFVLRHLRPEIERLRQPGRLTALTGDFKSALQERLQEAGQPAPAYRVVATEGPDHEKQFSVEVSSGDRVLAQATGASKKEAEQRAARLALEGLSGETVP
ncbi:MAG: ribonuclease III [Vicinamibacterales bacterium]|nr:ribonuclease III [Vicinamibacterales bacterium]